jgi:hypothetical protein
MSALQTEILQSQQRGPSVSPVIESSMDRDARSEIMGNKGGPKHRALQLYATARSDLSELGDIGLEDSMAFLSERAEPYDVWVPGIRDTLATYAAHPEILARDLDQRSANLADDRSGGTSKEYWADQTFVNFFQPFRRRTIRNDGALMTPQEDGAVAFDAVARLMHGRPAWDAYTEQTHSSFGTRLSDRVPVPLTREESTQIGEYTRELRPGSSVAIPGSTASLLSARETAKAGIYDGGELRFAFQLNDHDSPISYGIVEITDPEASKAANNARYALVELGLGDGQLAPRDTKSEALDGERRAGAISIRRKRLARSSTNEETGETAVKIIWKGSDLVAEFELSDNPVSVSLQAASTIDTVEKRQRTVGRHRRPSHARQLGRRVLARVA